MKNKRDLNNYIKHLIIKYKINEGYMESINLALAGAALDETIISLAALINTGIVAIDILKVIKEEIIYFFNNHYDQDISKKSLELKVLYNKYIKELSKYLKEKNVENPISIGIYFSNMLWDGNLSYTDKFAFKNSDPNFMPDKCTIKTDGNLECFSGTTSLGTVKVSMKGTKPTSGTIYITEDDITYENIILNGKTYYKKASNATLVNDAAPTGVSYGDKYTYKVNDTDTFNFYVLSVEGDKVNLIMDRNICEDGTVATEQNTCLVAWHAGEENNNYGPDTAMTYLYNTTKNWNNVPNVELTYTDENNQDDTTKGYTGITASNGVATITGKNGASNTTIGTASAPLKARLPKENEVSGTDGNHCTGSGGSCPAWLVGYLNDTGTPSSDSLYPNNELISGIDGYWLLSSTPGYSNGARDVIYDGFVSSGTSYASDYGVRPVITVSKSDLS